jgi:uncharacterized protein (DUF433 family)
MKAEKTEIIDVGRGPQLSNSRITVQDLLPYYREQATNDEIRRWIPRLTDDEIALLKNYMREHYEEVLQTERENKEYHDRKRSMQPAWTRAKVDLSIEERTELLKNRLQHRKVGKNGANHSPG